MRDAPNPPSPALPNREALLAAQERLRGRVHRTPLLGSSTLGERCGARVLLKCENLQRAGSFKIRGALNAVILAREAGEIGPAGVLTYSSGNHGQAVALAAREVGCPATVVVPEDIPAVKARALEGYGASLVRRGLTSVERQHAAEEIARRTGARIIPPFDDPAIIAGQATVALEILEDAPEVDLILVPVGGGGLLAGTALACLGREPRVRVVGVEPVDANTLQLALAAGRPVTLEQSPRTVADGLRPTATGDLPLRAAQRGVERIVLVDDEAILEAQHLILERAKLVVEPSGAAGVAGLLRHGHDLAPRTVAVILSGGNTPIPPPGRWSIDE